MSSNAALDVTGPETGGDSGASRSRRHLFGLCLLVFVTTMIEDIANRLLTHLQLITKHPSDVNYALTWVRSLVTAQEADDSWKPMRAALAWFQQHADGRLYEQIFFMDRIKFQYPLSSLLPLHALSQLGIAPPNAILNRVNFWMVLANILVAGALAFMLARRSPAYAPRRWQFAIVSAFGALLFCPLLRAFDLGQVQVWINTLFALSALAWLLGRKQLAGVLIGLICLLKPQFVMFMVWGLLRREWRFLMGWGAVTAVGLVASLAVFGVQNHLDYIAVLRTLSRTGEAFIENQSFNGLLNRLYGTDENPALWKPHDFPLFNPIVYAGTLLSSAVVIGAALLVPLRGKGASGLLDFLGAALSFTMASPIAWEHHYGILPVIYIAMMFVLLNRNASPGRSLGLATLSVSYVVTGHWMGSSWMLWGALALLGLIYWVILAPRGVTGVGTGERELAT
jgi:alpha-1,2-mannosyltransferase